MRGEPAAGSRIFTGEGPGPWRIKCRRFKTIKSTRPSGDWRTWSAPAGLALLAAAVCLALRPHTHEAAARHDYFLTTIPPILLALVVAVGLVGVAGRRRWRHALVLGLIVLLTMLTVETALHSVHHLGDAHAEASCVVAGATAHLGGVTTAPADLGEPVASPERTGDRGPTWPVPFQPVRPREGRAPPVPVLG